MTKLDAEFCAFECGRRATGVRPYTLGRETKFLAGCNNCDAQQRELLARELLARAEQRGARHRPRPLTSRAARG